MTHTSDNGGPAFPLQSIGPDCAPGYAGMTLRDYFAGQVIAGAGAFWLEKSATDAMIAAWAYETADAMLAARVQS